MCSVLSRVPIIQDKAAEQFRASLSVSANGINVTVSPDGYCTCIDDDVIDDDGE